jgi:simple sugar transport system ATP-binding protein
MSAPIEPTSSSLGNPDHVDSVDRAGARPLVIEAQAVSKSYGHVTALREVDLTIGRGEVVALIGDNGAGKSTLVKVIAGVFPPDTGRILVDGEEVQFRTPLDARRKGIETVYQNLALSAHLPIWANMFLGREVRVRGPLGRLGWLDRSTMRRRAAEELERLKIPVRSVDAPVSELSGGQRQAVAVARSISWGQKVVMMDEPTANLGVPEQQKVASLIRALAQHGVAVLLISHNLHEVFELADRLVVLRHGRRVADVKAADTAKEQVVGWITGAHGADGAEGFA